jgi:hypothetical protein
MKTITIQNSNLQWQEISGVLVAKTTMIRSRKIIWLRADIPGIFSTRSAAIKAS